jgi:hypothetical protein
MLLWVSKGFGGLRAKLHRQEGRVVVGIAAFSGMAEMTWSTTMSRWAKGMSIVGVLLPMTFSTLSHLYALISTARVHRTVRKYSTRLDKTIPAIELLEDDAIAQGQSNVPHGQVRQQQKLVVQKYRMWRKATMWTVRMVIVSFLVSVAMVSTIVALAGRLTKYEIELMAFQPSRLLFYLYVFWMWRPCVFPK